MPAARLAAERRSEEELERLRDAIPDEPLRLGTQRAVRLQPGLPLARDRRAAATRCSRSRRSRSSPCCRRNLARSKLGARFHRAINEHHRAIAAAIEAGDADAAGGEMHDHLEYLRPYYERAWRSAR